MAAHDDGQIGIVIGSCVLIACQAALSGVSGVPAKTLRHSKLLVSVHSRCPVARDQRRYLRQRRIDQRCAVLLWGTQAAMAEIRHASAVNS